MLGAGAASAWLTAPEGSALLPTLALPVRRAVAGALVGLLIAALVYSPWGRRSGSHLNPAITLAYLRLGKIGRWDAALYLLAQVGGALVAVALLRSGALLPAGAAPSLLSGFIGPRNEWAAFGTELVLSAGAMLMVLFTSNHAGWFRFTGLLYGLLMMLIVACAAPLSGFGMNLARLLAVDASSAASAFQWLNLLPPLLGMQLAVAGYRLFTGRTQVLCAKLAHNTHGRCIFRCQHPYQARALAIESVRRRRGEAPSTPHGPTPRGRTMSARAPWPAWALAVTCAVAAALPAAAQRAPAPAWSASPDGPSAPAWPASPDKLYAELFVDVQRAQLYPDQKSFVDATPKDGDPAAILASYRAQRGQPGFALKEFVDAHFAPPVDTPVTPPAGQGLREHIAWLWPALTRRSADVPANGSLLPLPRPYVVPGGRFREGYYWDSWFTMLGLQQDGREDLVDDMIENFASEIDRYGHVPNGNRSYYLSRSQPPFFALMVELAAARPEATPRLVRWLPQMRREHAYWMRGGETLPPGQAAANVVRLRDGALLNRWWDDEATPRPESWLQDVQTARQAPERPEAEVWRDLRAAAESGWDFSSRWFGDGRTIATIRTTAIVPVDLNALMVELERAIAKGCAAAADKPCAARFDRLARQRIAAIERHLWHPAGYYADYDWRLGRLRDDKTAAMLYPLFVGAAPAPRAARTLRTAECALLQPGGLATTTVRSGQQWDAPNGWAPLQWIADQAARRYGRPALAQAIDTRFLENVERVYAAEHKLVEKYVVDGSGGAGGGGEYPLQDGFGWSNGVAVRMLAQREADRARPAPRDTLTRCAP